MLHSISKYLNGHTDLIMGCLMFNDDTLAKEIYETQKKKGLHPAPFDAFLAHRSLTTFEVRDQQASMRLLIMILVPLKLHPNSRFECRGTRLTLYKWPSSWRLIHRYVFSNRDDQIEAHSDVKA